MPKLSAGASATMQHGVVHAVEAQGSAVLSGGTPFPFCVVTTTEAVARLFAASRASAVRVCTPSVTRVESHCKPLCGVASGGGGAERYAIERERHTHDADVVAVAVACTLIVPETLPAAGATNETHRRVGRQREELAGRQ